MQKLFDGLLVRWVPWLGYGVIRGLRWTMRMTTLNSETTDALWYEGRNFIVAFWHGRQLMMPFAYKGKKRISILISRHRDGELIARTVGYFGFHAVRGSTTRGGATALRRLVQSARSGDDLGVTPDGPRGPRQVVQPGVVELAKLTGLPILPLAFSASKKKSFSPGTAF
ncbi:MAG TPA: lysophospholipid acyltransferase family protein [Nitrospiria bacterium]|nr:lysophospholipid acyltransferase family protein [Nitrospiria bacterium]